MTKCSQLFISIWIALLVGSCTSAPAKSPADAQLRGPDRATVRLDHWLKQGRYTVVLFVSTNCGCVKAHAERVRTLAAKYASQRIQFLAVDPEFDATEETIRSERQRYGWEFPVLLDPKGELADRLEAEFAGYAVVLDAAGQVHYRGGVDSDRKQTHEDAVPYLANALDDLVAARPARVAQTEALGCVLRRNGP